LRGALFTVPELAAKALGSYLAKHLKRRFGSTGVGLTEFIPSAARLALDCIGNSDALYHNVEHTMLVTLVGYDIMRGSSAPNSDGRSCPVEWCNSGVAVVIAGEAGSIKLPPRRAA
jgi:hypothetical protein